MMNIGRRASLIAVTFIAVASSFFVCEQVSCAANRQRSSTISSSQLSQEITQLTEQLGYSERVAKDFTRLVSDWQDRRGQCTLAVWKEKLDNAKQDFKKGRISKAQLARKEENLTHRLCQKIRDEFGANDEYFDLADIIKHRQANCIGFAQLFYILGGSVGLEVRPIDVIEFVEADEMPAGSGHVACIVELSDGSTVMLNPVHWGFISKRFVFAKQFLRAGNYWQLQNTNNPLGLYRKVQILDTDGLSAYIYSSRGNVFTSTDKLNKAITAYSQAIELNPYFAQAWNNRGVAHSRTNQFDKAIADYDKAIQLNSDFVEAWNNRGIVYSTLDQFEQAISDYSRAIELKSDFAGCYNNRANAYARLHKFEQAVSDYSRAIKLDSNLAEAYGNRAVSFAILGKQKGAKKDLLRAVKINPELLPYAARVSERFDLNLNFQDSPLLAAK